MYDIRDAGVPTFEAHARARVAAYRSQGFTPEDLTPEALLARPVQLRSVLYRGPDAALYAVPAPAEGPAAAPSPPRPRKAPSRGVAAPAFRTLTPPTAAPDTAPMPPAPMRTTP